MTVDKGKVGFISPSNIAIIKYWGKHDGQIPANPSLSFTLSHANTTMEVEYIKPADFEEPKIELYFEGKYHETFTKKIKNYIHDVKDLIPNSGNCHLNISSYNSFPHSAGIASSASSMSALACCLYEIESRINKDFSLKTSRETFISNLARLASGSASRSIFGGYTVWGKTDLLEGSSNEYAIPVNYMINPVFSTFTDWIIIVDQEQKKVSSSSGHALMNNHPFAQERFKMAHRNLKNLLEALKTGDLESFIKISENEALTLHGLMLQSDPWYALLKPDTLAIINEIRAFREQNNIPVCFTLDAGPNVHVLFPANVEKEMMHLFENINDLCSNLKIIKDCVGKGPKPIIFDNEYN